MFGWLFRRDRAIYEYHDGSRRVRADPLKIVQRLEDCLPDHEILFATLAEKLDGPPPGPLRDSLVSQKKDAVRKIAKAAREIFELKPLGKTSAGVTDGEAIAVLAGFANFMADLAEKAALFQNLPQAG